ncbi:hypothetical protein FOZ62_002592 [Perkinsus olseni]|uniref:Uncharacterized protein n=1 Tax=Perkinsus olseni TaxID=32597 RepID=A0A7J6QWP7_PEROL|nr:hypothetical protein FOZ62_002592 [Perkinsus olseni]
MAGSLKGRLNRRKLHTVDDLSMVNPAEYWKFESFAQKQDEIGTFALYYLSFLMIFVLSMVWWLPVAGRDDDDDDAAKLAELPVYHTLEREYIRSLNLKEEAEERSLRHLANVIDRKEVSALGRQERIKVEKAIVNRVAQEGWYGRQRKTQHRANALENDFRTRADEELLRRDRSAEQLVQTRALRWAALAGRDIPKHAKALKSRQLQEWKTDKESVDHFKRQLASEESALRRQEERARERQLLKTLHSIEWGHKQQRFGNARQFLEEDFRARAAGELSVKEDRYQRLLSRRRSMSDMLAAEANYLSREINCLLRQKHSKCAC